MSTNNPYNSKILWNLPEVTFIFYASFSVCPYNALLFKKQFKILSLVNNDDCFLLKRQKYIYYSKLISHYINNYYFYIKQTIFELTLFF